MTGGDLVSRTALAPRELPVGIVTAAAGGLFVLVLVVRRPAARGPRVARPRRFR